MSLAEVEPRRDLVPKLTLDESLQAIDVPYQVNFNLEEYASFLLEHGMRPERINRLHINIKNLPIEVVSKTEGERYADSSDADYYIKGGEYNPKSREISLNASVYWHLYARTIHYMKNLSPGEEVSTKEALNRLFNAAALHEGIHAIDFQDNNSRHPGVNKELARSAGLLGLGIATTACAGLVLPQLGIPQFLSSTAGVGAGTLLGMKGMMNITNINNEIIKSERKAYVFEANNRDHLRWRSIATITPKN